jgi:subfamily B ATP-binding cassette protein MsbA
MKTPQRIEAGPMLQRRLLSYVRPWLPAMIAGILLTALASLATLGYAWASKELVQAVGAKSLSGLRNALLAVLALNVLKNAAQYGGGYTLTAVGQRVVARVRRDLFNRIQYLPLQVFDTWRSGELISRFDNDVMLVANGVQAMPLFSSAVLTLAGSLAGMFYLDWRLTLVTIAVAPVVALAVYRFSMLLRRLTMVSLGRIADLNATLQESLESMRIIKAFRREPYEVQRFSERNDAYLGASMKLAQITLTQVPVVDFVVTVGLLVLAGFSFYELVIGRQTAPQLAAFLMLTITASNPINQLTNYFGDLNKAYTGAGRIFEILSLPVEVADAPGARELETVRGKVEFREVTFSYDGEHDVLKGINASVEPGDIVALVGPSGAGKSTLVNLIPRFYVPRSGMLLVDGEDVKEVTLASLRDAIAIVPQDPQLFSDTIEENIRYGRLDATRAEIEAAARLANAHEFITGFADGYATLVGARGIRLSGGERQRIALARAILRDPRILVLDEATSSLDARSEALINDALDRVLVGRTTFVIAHRLSTIRRASVILVLADGRIVEQGTHAKLLAKRGLYADLYETQMLQLTSG